MRAAGPCISKAAAAVKVLLLGGYGVFGARLAKFLVIDGHDVCIAGRSLRAAQTCAAELGCRAIQMDRSLDLGALTAHDVVIDAAGPFHTYGDDPYRLARAAIAAGVHYLDLADDAGFCAGIAALDTDARAAGVCVLSGLSSVPALSSAAVRALAGGEVPSVIDTAILPGNRAPRGLSVMQSILSQAGRPMPLWHGNQ
ncbi:saccharopine dehydrogenase NADP-binding domain-containing protein [Loktanella salsilacus]|uniref:saccharopine dehydrogenase NADP-binding domain-containing protein n=1 Tax=Loktanella salsilacus TaxID=195913 RepID=UPI0030017409